MGYTIHQAPLFRPVQVTPRKKLFVERQSGLTCASWLPANSARHIVASSSGHLKKVNFQWVGLDRSYKNLFDINSRFFYLLGFVLFYHRDHQTLVFSCWCCGLFSFNGFCKSVREESRRVNFPLPATPDMMTIHFSFFLKICQNQFVLSLTILLEEICLIIVIFITTSFHAASFYSSFSTSHLMWPCELFSKIPLHFNS